jgi:ankyrin repeat protein
MIFCAYRPEVVIATLSPKLDVLIDMMMMFDPNPQEKKVDQRVASADDGLRNLPSYDGLRKSSYRLKEVAQQVISSASTNHPDESTQQVFSTTGSEYGVPFSNDLVARVRGWNLETFLEEKEDELQSTPSSRQKRETMGSERQPQTLNDIEAEFVDGSDSEGDIAIEIFQVLGDTGSAHFEHKNYKDASRFLRRALDAASSKSNKLTHSLRLKLGVSLYELEEPQESKEVLLDLVRSYEADPGILEPLNVLLASHILARIYTALNQLDNAEIYCKRAILGRRRMLGKTHHEYFESVSLLVSIYEAKDEPELAFAYQAMLLQDSKVDSNLWLNPRDRSSSMKLPVKPLPNKPESASQLSLNLTEARPQATSTPAKAENAVGTTQEGTEKPLYSDKYSKPPGPEQLKSSFLAFTPQTSKQVAITSLREAGWEITSASCDLKEAMFWACRVGNLPAVKILGPLVKNINKSDKGARGLTALHYASQGDCERLVPLLLKYGANIEICAKGKVTPLMTAVDYHRPDRIRELMAGGANLYSQKDRALRVAVGHKIICSMAVLLEFVDWDKCYAGLRGVNLVDHACRIGTLEMVQLLAEKGANLEFKHTCCYSPLFEATEGNFIEVVKFLLDEGVNVNSRCPQGTPLKSAARNGRLDLVRLLLDRGADPDLYDSGKTALAKAIKYGHTEVAELLIERGGTMRQKRKDRKY